jgi:adenosine deaminase
VLGLNRIGHGVRAATSPEVMQKLANLGTPLEICITSNLALGVCRDLSRHPVVNLVEAGCAITLGTDDPAFFETSPAREYELAGAILPGLTVECISRAAIEAAFCDEETKASLRPRLAS